METLLNAFFNFFRWILSPLKRHKTPEARERGLEQYRQQNNANELEGDPLGGPEGGDFGDGNDADGDGH